MDSVVAATVMRALLHVCMLRECDGDGNVDVGDGGCVVVVSAENVGGTRGSEIVSTAADVLGMSVMRGMRGVGGMCEMCMCLVRGGCCTLSIWMPYMLPFHLLSDMVHLYLPTTISYPIWSNFISQLLSPI